MRKYVPVSLWPQIPTMLLTIVAAVWPAYHPPWFTVERFACFVASLGVLTIVLAGLAAARLERPQREQEAHERTVASLTYFLEQANHQQEPGLGLSLGATAYISEAKETLLADAELGLPRFSGQRIKLH